jgi:hypothetical protein
MSPVGLGTKNHCAGEGKQQFSSQSAFCDFSQYLRTMSEFPRCKPQSLTSRHLATNRSKYPTPVTGQYFAPLAHIAEPRQLMHLCPHIAVDVRRQKNYELWEMIAVYNGIVWTYWEESQKSVSVVGSELRFELVTSTIHVIRASTKLTCSVTVALFGRVVWGLLKVHLWQLVSLNSAEKSRTDHNIAKAHVNLDKLSFHSVALLFSPRLIGAGVVQSL